MAEWTARRSANADAIHAACRPYPAARVPAFACAGKACDPTCASRKGCVHAQYKCYVYVAPEGLAEGWSRDRIIESINALGVPCYQGSCSEVYLERAFEGTGWVPSVRLPVARELGETSLMFLVHPTLSAGDVNQACGAIRSVLAEASA